MFVFIFRPFLRIDQENQLDVANDDVVQHMASPPLVCNNVVTRSDDRARRDRGVTVRVGEGRETNHY